MALVTVDKNVRDTRRDTLENPNKIKACQRTGKKGFARYKTRSGWKVFLDKAFLGTVGGREIQDEMALPYNERYYCYSHI